MNRVHIRGLGDPGDFRKVCRRRFLRIRGPGHPEPMGVGPESCSDQLHDLENHQALSPDFFRLPPLGPPVDIRRDLPPDLRVEGAVGELNYKGRELGALDLVNYLLAAKCRQEIIEFQLLGDCCPSQCINQRLHQPRTAARYDEDSGESRTIIISRAHRRIGDRLARFIIFLIVVPIRRRR
jgi:hypothetical protein